MNYQQNKYCRSQAPKEKDIGRKKIFRFPDCRLDSQAGPSMLHYPEMNRRLCCLPEPKEARQLKSTKHLHWGSDLVFEITTTQGSSPVLSENLCSPCQTLLLWKGSQEVLCKLLQCRLPLWTFVSTSASLTSHTNIHSLFCKLLDLSASLKSFVRCFHGI